MWGCVRGGARGCVGVGGCAWVRVGARGCAWVRVGARGCAWVRVGARGCAWVRMGVWVCVCVCVNIARPAHAGLNMFPFHQQSGGPSMYCE